MQDTTTITIGDAFEGPVDRGAERSARRGSAEACAHALLRLVADHPGQMGRLRAARVLGSYPIPPAGDALPTDFAVGADWTLRELTQLVDAVLRGGLMVQTPGARPVLVLTRAGHRALEALEVGAAPACT